MRSRVQGVSAPLVGAACENACLFLTYNKFQDIILSIRPSVGEVTATDGAKIERRQLSLGELALAAGAAGAAASFLLTPIELVKCRMQVQRLAQEGVFGTAPAPSTAVAAGTRAYSTTATVNKAKLQGPFEIVRSTIAAHGLKGLWLGQTGTLFRETGGSAAWFGAYEAVSRAFISVKQAQVTSLGSDAKITKKDLSTLQLMAAGACAGMSYNIVLFPADCVKSAMQTQEELRPRQRGPDGKSIGEGPKFWGVAKRIYQSRGIRGLYAGCGVTVARAAPSSAMIFLIYESLESRFGNLFA
ncbi:hypothetical protein QFC24_003752 [Naganishia onofrii]|uniref:Uncharacterized protein n=1 Tax=Naganishia onofrii TaxID=1851511 RepID=A0ACC2XJS7_9TREE|nr:hypothetical protein QFC24_003752 [Naganishia onofrii]